jgi:hypothetical protein
MSQHKKHAVLHPSVREKPKHEQGIPLVVVLWAFGLALLSYAASRFVVSYHPLHWASLAGGALLGVIIGYIWYLARGDVNLF